MAVVVVGEPGGEFRVAVLNEEGDDLTNDIAGLLPLSSDSGNESVEDQFVCCWFKGAPG